MTTYYIGLQNKPGITDPPAYINTSSDTTSVDIEVRVDGTKVADVATFEILMEKLKHAIIMAGWPPANQAL